MSKPPSRRPPSKGGFSSSRSSQEGGGRKAPRPGKDQRAAMRGGDQRAAKRGSDQHSAKREGDQRPAFPKRTTRPGERHERGDRTIDRALQRVETRERPNRERPEREYASREQSGREQQGDRPQSFKPKRFDRDEGRPHQSRPYDSRKHEGTKRNDRRRDDAGTDDTRQKRAPLRPGSSRQVISGAIQLLQAIEGSGEPADRVLHAWMKSNHRRFEVPERAAIVQIAEDVQRHRGRLDWWIARSSQGKVKPGMDLRVAAYRILANGAKVAGVTAALNLQLSEVEGITALLQPLEGHTLDHPDMPATARYSLPAWIEPRFRARFGADFDLEMAASLRPAPLDLRVNRLKTTRDAAMGVLGAAGMRAQATPLSPIGLRLGPQAYVNNSQAFAEGLIEPQDEGSQIAAMLVEAAGAKYVVDFCAGAGGKTLAIGAAMNNAGRLVACDVSEKRLERARQRLRRAGVHNVECRALEGKWLKRQAAKADRVLVDAPCTGTGTWRRKPDARWRLTETDLQELVQRQAEILERAAKLVAPGGRLIYVTCSVLIEENDAQIEAFLKTHAEFAPMPVADIWARTIGGVCPTAERFLRLTPGRHGTDGFFVAILEKKA